MQDNNIERIRSQISKKKGNLPYFPSQEDVTSIITDYDMFPYIRYFRGEYTSTEPVIAEREAGFRKRMDSCYESRVCQKEDVYPNNCFEAPCSTVFPCYPQNLEYKVERPINMYR